MNANATSAPITLYGVPHSLYTARARSYFIKAGLAYREVAPNDPHYQSEVIAKAGGKLGLPTIEAADGTVIRDGAQIINHFEEASGHTFSPTGPKQRFFSRLFDAIGAEGLLRPAMHYRWNFDAENLDFLTFHFEML
ncbi:MAG: glutathione S-transferase N-terminal domain-containing protein, partial [Pseudomonadota bacterium]